MERYNQEIKIPRSKLDAYQALMDGSPDYDQNDIPRYATVNSWTVKFPDGREMDVKLCSSDDGDPLWSEAVLFTNGCECGCTEPGDELAGEYIIEKDGVAYVVNVVADDTEGAE